MKIHFNNEPQECKTGLLKGRRRVNTEGGEG
jgi:hypothetical protein